MKNYDEYINQVEQYARDNPKGYRLKLSLLTMLGYVFIIGLLLFFGLCLLLLLAMLIIGLKFKFIILKFAFGLIVVIFFILRSFWVKFEKPEGIKIDLKKLSPELYNTIEEIRKKAKCPPLHAVYVDYDFNLYVMQIPRLGIFGLPVNYLVIGLPAIMCLAPEQFKAVLAHELGHISSAHGMSGSRIYMLRKTWYQLLTNLEQQHSDILSKLCWSFFEWYIPFYHAYSFVMARQNEYEADNYAAEIVGKKASGEALINFEVSALYLSDDYWPNFYKQVINNKETPDNAITDLSTCLSKRIPEDEGLKFLARSMIHKTQNIDVHPSLEDRLKNIGTIASLPEPNKISAAEHYFGENLKPLMEELDKLWKRENTGKWNEQYAAYEEIKTKIKSLEEKEELSKDEIYDYALNYEKINGPEQALPIYEKILELAPNEAFANYSVGRILLKQNNSTGIYLVNKASELDNVYTLYTTEQLYDYFIKNLKPVEADIYYKKYLDQIELERLAVEERAALTNKDTIIAHNLPLDLVKMLQNCFKDKPNISKVYLAEKKVEYRLDSPFYVVLIDINWPWHKFKSAQFKDIDSINIINSMADNIKLPPDFKGSFLPLNLNHSSGCYKYLLKKFQAITGSLIYEKGKEIDFSYEYSISETDNKQVSDNFNNDHYRFEKLLELSFQLLDQKEKEHGHNHPSVAAVYDDIAKIYRDKGDYYHALKYYDSALKIFLDVNGENHPSIATINNNIAAVHFNMKDYNKAIELYSKALDLVNNTLGDQHQFSAILYNNLGETFKRINDYDKALDYYNKALEIKSAVFGKDHKSTLTTINNINTLKQSIEL